MHSVTDKPTDRQTDDMMKPIADHTVQQYDRLKGAIYHSSRCILVSDVVCCTTVRIRVFLVTDLACCVVYMAEDVR